ncbi:MAG: hypothetical protein NWF05_11060 [Candidatus Bathyarchaeota archaeon]|nr:hypothetical protein [Candidatus Bathyarchaeota archaeon]
MAFPRSSSRGTSAKVRKASSRKTKSKAAKKPSEIKYAPEVSAPSPEETAEKAVGILERLGSQIFALSPFSQYFDDWLVRLRQALLDFETVAAIKADEAFVKERTQILADVEGKLAEIRLKEAEMDAAAQELAETNHHIVDLDAGYATQNRELSENRNSTIERLTKNVHDIEEELVQVGQMKTSFFGFTKKAKRQREEATTQRLNAAKAELEVTVQNFGVEQETLHDDYAEKKQAAIEKAQGLEKEIVDIETDRSAEIREAAAEGLANAVKSLLQRQTAPPE